MKKLFGSLILSVLMITLLCAPIVLAADNATNGDVPPLENGFMVEIETLWTMLLAYVIAALVWAFSGFFKVKDPKEDTFDPVQFFTSMLVGLITGVIAFAIFVVTGESLMPETIVGYLLAIGFVGFVETWMKVFWRRIKPYFTPPALSTT